jgi:hypothetical protein
MNPVMMGRLPSIPPRPPGEAVSANDQNPDRQPDRGAGPAGGHGRLRTAAELATILALIVGLLAWLLPRDKEPDRSQAKETTQPGPARTSTAPPGDRVTPGTDPSPIMLNTIGPSRGRENFVALPRPLAGTDGYADPVIIRCPSNEAGDQTREVTWTLSGRHLRFAATARFFYDPPTDSLVDVTPVVGTQQRNGQISTVEAGRQRLTKPGTGTELTVPVEGAQELTIRVDCQKVGGVVILAGARLTPAD